jgi:acetyl esterase/lipase
LCLALAGCQQAYFHALNIGSDRPAPEVEVFDKAHGLSLDIDRPANASGAAPVVIFFYGGSWQHGRREYYRFVGRALSAQGFLVLVPDYRKAPAYRFPAFIDDAATATAWARAHAAQLGGDRRRIFLMGHSAGAHIAALLATDSRYLQAQAMRPRDLAGVIGLAGPYDFLPISNPRLQRVFANREQWPASQPVNFVDGDEPPFLLLHGGSDRKVAKQNSERLAAKLRAAGEPVTLHILPGIGHARLVDGFASPRFSPVLAETSDWIRGH